MATIVKMHVTANGKWCIRKPSGELDWRWMGGIIALLCYVHIFKSFFETDYNIVQSSSYETAFINVVSSLLLSTVVLVILPYIHTSLLVCLLKYSAE